MGFAREILLRMLRRARCCTVKTPTVLGWTNLDFVSYDISKCFDSLPWQSVQNALEACGFHAETVRALRDSWESVHRFWKLHGRVQMSTVSPANGLLQGDPTAPACLAAWMVEPVSHINRVWPSVEYHNSLMTCFLRRRTLLLCTRPTNTLKTGFGVYLQLLTAW